MHSDDALLALNSVEGLGPRTLLKILETVQDPSLLWSMDDGALLKAGMPIRMVERLKSLEPQKIVEEQRTKAEQLGVRLLFWNQPDYPSCLLDIPEAPWLLFVQGTWPLRDPLPGVAIIGPRKASSYGLRMATESARVVAENGIPVVSGYALGVDAAAHGAAVQANGTTVAVLGCGLDYDYPAHNAALRPRILDAGGALLTEFSFGTAPMPCHFPRRNRLVSGLSRAVALMEAGEKSGALITARCALEQGRDVFAVPGMVDAPLSVGTNRLIRDGAHPLLFPEDLLLLWKGVVEKKTKVALPKVVKAAPPVVTLEGAEKVLWERLQAEPLHVDKLAELSELKSSELLGTLFNLEMKGMAQQHPGMHFSRAC